MFRPGMEICAQEEMNLKCWKMPGVYNNNTQKDPVIHQKDHERLSYLEELPEMDSVKPVTRLCSALK